MHARIPMPFRIRPQYAKQFQCLGSKCEDNCCRNWEVPIDRVAYERFAHNPALQPNLHEYFSLAPEGGASGRYALINLTPSGTCPFLSETRLCNLQVEYGESYLSNVCTTYPRNPHRIDGLLEQPLSLSCIEAARLVLLNPQLLPRSESKKSPYSRFLLMPNRGIPEQGKKFRHFWDVREFCLALVQDRSYPLWQRLFLLGMFSKRLGEILAASQFGLTPKLLREYAEIISSRNLVGDLDCIPVRAGAQLQMVIEVVSVYLRQHKPELCRIHECIEDFFQGIGYVPSSNLEDCTQCYSVAHREHYQPFMEQHPYLLENYLINHIFRVVFPFGQNPENVFERPQREFLTLCLEFAVLKGLLIGIAGHYREALRVEHVIKVAQCLAKSFEHDPTPGGALNWQGLSDPNSVAALLKN